jgi:formate hydrogenlyase subunit 4
MITDVSNVIFSIIQAIFLIIIAPLYIGIIRKVKARLQSRKGAKIIQPYYDLMKLFQKGSVVSKTTSWMFQITPYVCISTIIVVTLMIPAFAATSLNIIGGITVMIYLLAAMRIFMVLSGLDAGTAFGGMGSSREALISALAEPVILLCLFSVAILTNTLYLGNMSSTLVESGITLLNPSLILAAVAFFIITLAENARIPFDNPTTHLELTMVHEAMILEYSGKQLGLMELSSWIKHIVFFTILANMFFPWGIATEITFPAILLGLIVFFAKTIIIALLVAYVESAISKLRLFRVPNMLGISFTLALMAILLNYIL